MPLPIRPDASTYRPPAPAHRPSARVRTRERLRAVVIGASTGGIEALNHLLPLLPADLPVPIFVVLHLRPDAPSSLSTLFAGRCALRVAEAEDKMPVTPGTLYFAPPDYHLLLDADLGPDGNAVPCLALSTEPPERFSRPSIDVLFESAATVYGGGLLGVLLTGANDDGAAGLEAVRHAGGQAWVQAPATALSAEMPDAAIRRGAVDRVLTLPQIASRLARTTHRLHRAEQVAAAAHTDTLTAAEPAEQAQCAGPAILARGP